MLAFLVAGVILGVLARLLHHDADDPHPVLTVVVGVVAAVVAGVLMNLVLSDPVTHLSAWSFAAACIVSFVVLGVLEGVWWRRS